MHSVTIDKAGLLSTIQDTGRRGLRHLGIPWSGTMVPCWQAVANVLVGNEPEHSVIECFEGGLVFTVGDEPVRIAIAASQQSSIAVGAQQARSTLEPFRSHTIMPGERVTVKSTGNSRLAVIALAGLQIPSQLGSSSTYAKAGLGGLAGSPLQAGDKLRVATKPDGPEIKADQTLLPDYHRHEIRVVLGPQNENFSDAGIQTFLGSDYTLTTDADRMGARFDGAIIEHRDQKARDPISDAIVPGSIQVPGSGLPIVLLSDAHTAGGYPKIAHRTFH